MLFLSLIHLLCDFYNEVIQYGLCHLISCSSFQSTGYSVDTRCICSFYADLTCVVSVRPMFCVCVLVRVRRYCVILLDFYG
jgi:hypothetical protein